MNQIYLTNLSWFAYLSSSLVKPVSLALATFSE